MRFHLDKHQEPETRPEADDGEDSPFIEREMEEGASPGGLWGKVRQAGLLSCEVEIRADIGIARSELMGDAKVENGPADLIRKEEGIAHVKVEGMGMDTLLEKRLVGIDCFRVAGLFVEAIGFSEGSLGG